jgi:hypothetical protein
MARHTPKRTCKHGQTFFVPDPRCVRRQRHCSTPACRKASKADSQRRWHHTPDHRDYFKGPIHVERVRAWRQAHPGYWRRKASGLPRALQEDFMLQPSQKQLLDDTLTAGAFQEDLFRQPAVLVGLIAHCTGLAFQEDIAMTARRLQPLGAIFSPVSPLNQEAASRHTPPISFVKLRTIPSQFSWVDQRLVREHSLDRLSHAACALSLFLVTVADAQGRSYYAERSLCQRLSLSVAQLRQARQLLITPHLLAYRRPLSQVFALGAEAGAPAACPKADDNEVDLQAVFTRIWEVLA